MVDKTYPMTHAGRARLEQELSELRERRRTLAERMHAAREFSTTQDNAEYDEVNAERELNESRIGAIEQQLLHAVIIDEAQAHGANAVLVGATVVVAVNGREQEYTIVGSLEADPASGRISNESPVGRALLGKRVGDEVKVMAPKGLVTIKVTAIK